jgi:hypothetical protein
MYFGDPLQLGVINHLGDHPSKRNDPTADAGKEEVPLPEKGEFIMFLSFIERDLSFHTSHFL